MHIPPRYIALRLVILAGVLVWAWWKMRSPVAGPTVATLTGEPPPAPAERLLVERPSPATAPEGLAPVADPVALFDALSAAATGSAACGAGAVELTVVVGPGGLESARLTGAGLATLSDAAAACVTAAVEGREWPTGSAPAEGTIALPTP